MRVASPLVAALASLCASAAVADIPPLPYQGPDQVTLGALNFRHAREEGALCGGGHCQHTYRDRVLLAGCEGKSSNCDAVTRDGVLGWEVVSADGGDFDGDIRLLIGAFAATKPGTKVKVVFRQVGGAQPRQVEVQLDQK